jgi:hypothetical protein
VLSDPLIIGIRKVPQKLTLFCRKKDLRVSAPPGHTVPVISKKMTFVSKIMFMGVAI